MHHDTIMDLNKDDDEINAEIQKELEALTEQDVESWEEEKTEEVAETEHDTTDEQEEVSESMEQYLKLVQQQEERWKEQIQECDQILAHTNTALTTPRSVRLDKDIYGEHSDPEQLTQKVLNELEKSEETDRQRVLEQAAAIVQGGAELKQEDSMAVKTISKESVSEENQSEANGNGDGQKSNNIEENGNGDEQADLTLQPEEGVVAVMLDSDTLEQNMYEKIREWEERRQQLEEKRQQELEESKLEEYKQAQEREFKRKEKQQQLELEQQQLQRIHQEQEERMKKEAEEFNQKLEESLREQKEEIDKLDSQVREEKENLEKDKEERQKQIEKQRESAATRLQAAFRSLRVRLEMSGLLKQKREKRKEEQEQERIKVIEDERKKKEEMERKIKEEEERKKREKEEAERKRREEEELRRKMEEEEKIKQEEEAKKRKEEELQRKKEEEQKIKEEAERKKREKEELKRKQEEEQQRRKEEEMRRKQEEERKRKEEAELKKKREEEMKRQKEEEVRRKKEEEIQRKLEDELKKKQEAELKIKQENERRRKEQEAIQKQKEEEQRKKQEEEQKKIAEEEDKNRKIEDEKKKQREIEEKNRAAIQRMQASMSTSMSSEHVFLPTKTLDMESLQQFIDDKRLSWIKQCKPLSQSTSEQKCRRHTAGNKRLPRRPASSKQLPFLTDSNVLQAAKTSSLQQVTTVEIKDLPGCRGVNILSQCPHLHSLTITSCQLQALEGLQSCNKLQYLNVQNNQLELIDVRQMSSLVYVDLSHNRLTSIHGLDGCFGVRYLSLAHNNLTRIGGLETQHALHTLDVSHNQLISCQGLRDVISVQRLDLSSNHLPALDDIKSLGLLQHLDASHNNIMQIPELTDQVLLRDIILNDNSISSLQNLAMSWLPHLTKISLSKNSLLAVDELPGCVLLQSLDISNNQILEQNSLLGGLSQMYSLENLTMDGNPVTAEHSAERCVRHYVQSLHTLNGATIPDPADVKLTDFQKMCLQQIEAHDKLHSAFMQALSSSTLPTRGPIHEQFYMQSSSLSVEQRFVHEYGTVLLDTKVVEPNFDIKEEIVAAETKPVNDARSKFEDALVNSSPRVNKIDSKSQFEQALKDTTYAKSKFDSSLQSQSVTSDAKSKVDCMLENQSKGKFSLSQGGGAAMPQTSVTASVVGQILQQATKRHHAAATKIQALWRGYILRKRLQMALDYARFEEISDDDEDFFNEEIDMSAFNFNEDDLDAEWKCPATPQMPIQHPVIGNNNNAQIKYNQEAPYRPHPPGQPRQAWRNSESPMMHHFPSGKPPLPPVSPSVGAETHRTVDTNKTKKSDKITEEWGFKDSRTAELMLQRAKKLKYNSQRKKKLSQLDPRQKLALFKKLEESKQLRPVQPPSRKAAVRKEYFQAKEEEEYYKVQHKVEEHTMRNSRTYEWVHEQVGRYDPSDVSPPRQGLTRHYASDGSLPQMDRSVLAGGRMNLTGSPVSIELESVSSYTNNSSMSRRHSSTEGSNVQFPQIKTSSAPSAHQKERMSFRNPVVNQSVGWGGGKKRGRRF